jgi:hypothetical protein
MLHDAYGLYNQTCHKTFTSSWKWHKVLYMLTCTHKLAFRLSALSITVGFSSVWSAFKMWPQRSRKMMSISVHTDIQWRSARSQARLDWHKGLTHERTHGQCTNALAKARGYWSMYIFASITFSMRITAYKKKRATDRCISLLLLFLTCASPRTKSKRVSIDIPLCFYYF